VAVDPAEIERELTKLEAIQADLAAIATRDDEGRRADLIALRRQLSDQIALLGRLADDLFGNHVSPELKAEYRSRFSAMRSKTALHQANWPAVRLGQFDDDYRTSATGVRDANRAFVAWMRATLRQLRTAPGGAREP
jgi:hypothetical protein